MPFIVPAAKRVPTNLGVREGRLAACPNSPNCVSSQSDRASQAVDPIACVGDPLNAFSKFADLVAADPRATVLTRTDRYVHAAFRAMMFIDDLEAYLPEGSNVIQVRSASRVGHSDLGANRRRVEALRQAFSSQL